MDRQQFSTVYISFTAYSALSLATDMWLAHAGLDVLRQEVVLAPFSVLLS